MSNVESLPVLLKELKLGEFMKAWEPLSHKASDEHWLYPQYLADLCGQEAAERYRKKILRLTRESQLPCGKSLESFDFSLTKSIKKNQVNRFIKDSSWVNKAENIMLFGPSGVGKTHIAAAIGYGLIEKGVRVKFTPATALVQSLQKARDELILTDMLTRLDKYAVLILDDIGYVKKTEVESQVLFELIAHRYETGSLIITSNQPFSKWDTIFEDNMMTVAAIDRLVHHATVLEYKEESYRKKQSTKRKSRQQSV